MTAYTLFIPDISGFTKFVKHTEINHSRHIIEELIHLIIEQVDADFKVAEIEGDAVFFYSDAPCPGEKIMDISKKMFLAFHRHLLNYQHNRICNCGACSTAVNLKLKFVVHSGALQLAHFGKRGSKPFGDSVIEIHRLLKNDVPSDEYVLMSDKIRCDETITFDGKGFKSEKDLGDIHYRYVDIAAWKEKINVENQESVHTKKDLVVEETRKIGTHAQLLHHFISDFRYRKLWNIAATEIIYEQEAINQAGTEHFCVVNGKELFFDTVKTEYDAGLSYGEILKNPSPFKYVEIKFFIKPEGPDACEIRQIMGVSYKWYVQRLFSPFIAKELKKRVNEALNAIETAIKEQDLALADEVSIPE